jgi:hypothetical protein
MVGMPRAPGHRLEARRDMAYDSERGGILVDFEPMSPEERERMMQFLLNQQAQFAADHAKSQERLGRVEGALIAVTGVLGRLAENAERHDVEIAELKAAEARADERWARLEEKFERTGERLDIVVNMFERHLREDPGIQ